MLFVCALSAAGSLYLIVQMDQPYTGPIKTSSAPVRTASNQLGQHLTLTSKVRSWHTCRE
jgi:hypothetical protein